MISTGRRKTIARGQTSAQRPVRHPAPTLAQANGHLLQQAPRFPHQKILTNHTSQLPCVCSVKTQAERR
jgi:hypothetical protein